tara:strand:- start:189 stop:1508 length:1320 start_codon:yes stop_codon:yes gene_type:complete
MAKSPFKIKPKTWPKELTFEEFQRLNPTISETLLINYYHKYLQEYVEQNSRHLEYFDDLKTTISEEIKLLKNKQNWDYDGDQTVGPTGAGRKFRSPFPSLKNSLTFDGTDDHILCGILGELPSNNTLKPYDQLTISSWVHSHPTEGPYNTVAPTQYHVCAASQNSGYRFYHYHKQFTWVLVTTKSDGSKQTNILQNGFNKMTPGKPLAHFDGPLSGSGWHYMTCTYDGRYMKMYADGKLITIGSVSSGGGTYTDGVLDTGHNSDPNILRVSGSEGAIWWDMVSGGGPATGIPYKALVDFSIGSLTQNHSNVSPATTQLSHSPWSGSIAEVAVWDKCLDADTIYDIYQNNVSASQGENGKYDLSYKGYGTDISPNYHSHPYDLVDEGITYKNVGKYVNNLQGWWKLEENTGTITKDLSKNKNDGTLYNSPTWSGSFAPGI